jgi:hypothetical protein
MDPYTQDESNTWIGDPRHDAEGRVEDPNVAAAFDEQAQPRGREYAFEQGSEVQRDLERYPEYRQMAEGDPDADLNDANFVGEQIMAMPTPDQSDTEMLGRAAGLSYEDTEPLGVADKIEKRDRERWELDPASSEDFQERRRQQE